MTTTEKITILLADDHELVRNGIKALLQSDDSLQVIAEAANGREALDKIASEQPDLAIIDVRMPELNGIDTVAHVIQSGSTTKPIVLSMHDSEEYVLKSIEAGSFGYLLKDTSKEEFLRAIHMVANGEKYFSADISQILANKYLENLTSGPTNDPVSNSTPSITLTKREKQVMDMALEGFSNKEIASNLNKSVRTIEAHRFNLMKKLKVKNIAELSAKAKSLGLI
ncbi:MAG: response regulator transcription factor [Saprospiraceae bacterium]|nr:response regulator transcription factor [Saprospiraceae bacterium]